MTQGKIDDLALPLMQDVQLGVAARCEAANDAGDLPGILDRLAVYRGNDVARFDSTLRGGPVFCGSATKAPSAFFRPKLSAISCVTG